MVRTTSTLPVQVRGRHAPRRLRPRRANWLLAVVAFHGGCSSEARHAYDCDCATLTDTDVPGAHARRVCAASSAAAEGAARDCLRGEGVGQVEACRCAATPAACTADRCEAR